MNDCDFNNTNNMDNLQEELKEAKPAEELDQEKEIYKSPVIKNDSGNETEDIILEDKNEHQNAQKCDDLEESNNIHKKVLAIIDSDSEDEVLFNAKPKRKKAICDNSEDEASDSNQNESEKHPNNNKNAKTDFDSDSNNTSNTINGNDNAERNRFNALIDSDSEIEEDEEDGKHSTPIPDKKISKRKDDKEPKSKARKVSARASKEEAMKQIRYETQRLIREAEVSVPYHKPRQQSLEAFLSRKKIISALPKAPTMATRLKLSSAIVDEVLKEKEKEAEIFYKSSDSEEEIIEDHSDKENLDCQQVVKNPSRRLFTDDKSSTSNSQEQNAANEVQTAQEIQQALIETKEDENEVAADKEAKNANDSMTVEIHCDFNDPENIEKTVKPLETSQSVVENDADTSVNENGVESLHNDSEKSNKDTPDSVLKIDHDCEFVIDSPDINEKKSLLKLKNFKPQLKGAPGTIIDLTDDSEPSKGGINSLIDRFVSRHSKVDKCKKDTTVTATRVMESPAGISVVKETLPYKGIAAASEDPKLARPGAKLVRLREELKHKMAQKRNEEWKQREQEMKEQEIEWDESINEEECLSDPGSLTAESSESEEEELEEYDVPVKNKKKKKKSAYIDDEADVSDEIEDAEEDEDEDRDEEEEDEVLEDSEDCDNEDLKSRPFKRILEPLEEDSRFSSNENDMQVSQEHPEDNPICRTPEMKTTCYDLVSPTTQLTALNAKTESDEGSPEIEKQLPILIGFTQSQMFEEKPTLEEEPKQDGLNLHLSSEPNVTESQLLNLCSGTFGSQANDPPFSVDVSQNVQTSVENDPPFSVDVSQNVQTSVEKDSLSTNEHANDEEQPSKTNTATWNKLTVVSSDEEDLEDNGVKKRAKKKVKKLDLSEDEDEQSSDDEDQGEDEEQDEEKYIDYDSEENEVVVSSKNMKQYATKFLDEEAELSESDCDVSADENEEDLDKLEYEDMDDEEIDESRVKKQLEKLHVKQILDEDQREVRMLKELLFEEGDLYSESGRERKFKWRNIDKQENSDDVPSEDKDGWVDLSDDEEEAKWRKLKYEREKFLAEKLGNMDADIEEDLYNSQILNLGMKVLKKRRINESTNQETVLESLNSKVDLRIPHTVAEMLNNSKLDKNSRTIHSVLQKRSLLAKGEKSLARLAALVKQKNTTLPSFKARNFVFAHIDESSKVQGSSTTTKVMPKPLTAKRNR